MRIGAFVCLVGAVVSGQGVFGAPVSAKTPKPAPAPLTGQASVIDGDTVDIRGRRVRLFGIDAPESAQMCFQIDGTRWPCGRRAAFALTDLIGSQNLTCQYRGVDRDDRMIGLCSIGTIDIQERMVAGGWALAFVRYARDYLPAQSIARQAKSGMWIGRFQAPWAWRRDRNAPMFEAVSGPPI